VASETSRRYITNLLAATAATKTEDSEDSSGDSEAEAWREIVMRVGAMDVVRRILQGMVANSFDEGMQAMGRRARTIRFSRRF